MRGSRTVMSTKVTTIKEGPKAKVDDSGQKPERYMKVSGIKE